MTTTLRGYIGSKGYILGLYRDNGKENGFLMFWVVVNMMVPFGIPIIMRHLIFRVSQKGTITLTTTPIPHMHPRRTLRGAILKVQGFRV